MPPIPGETVEARAPHEALPPRFSDDDLALAFAERHANDLRYVAAFNKWFAWTGTHWAVDDTLNVYDKARIICRQAAEEKGGGRAQHEYL